MSTDAGGPAFPRLGLQIKSPDGKVVPHDPGMTLRDYFAAKAMQGLLAGKLKSTELRLIADDCYAMADAMLKARGP